MYTLNQARIVLAAAGLACLLSSATLAQVTSGHIYWTDGEGNTHAARGVRVETFGSGPLFSGQTGMVHADLDGFYSSVFAPPPGGLAVVEAHPDADNGAGYVYPTGPAPVRPPPFPFVPEPIYHGAVSGPPGVVDVTMPNTSDAGKAFSIADALYTGQHFAAAVRSAGAPPEVPAVYDHAHDGTAYHPDTGILTITGATAAGDDDAYDWDVILHEYGHYLSHLDGLDMEVGATHSFGTTNITSAATKMSGARLAWGEGLATYLGVAAQHVDTAGQHMPTGLLDVGDTKYTDRKTDRSVIGNDIDLATSYGNASAGGGRQQGEGDETSVMRVLWHLASANPAPGAPGYDPHDRIALGHPGLYSMLSEIGGLSQLNDVWNRLYVTHTSDSFRADMGGIFEECGVSPHPTGAIVGATLAYGSDAPTFSWVRMNGDATIGGGANDTFQILVFDPAFASRLLTILVPGDVTSYTLSATQWATLSDLAESGPVNFKFVITGSDAIDPTGTPYASDLSTGAYWSDAYGFTLIPSPGAWTLAACALVVLRRRRRA
jgi:hypothetical protein